MIRAHKIRLNPTPEQEPYFRKAAGTKRFVYNQALALWQWGKAQGIPDFGPMEIKRQMNMFKEEQFPWMYEVAKDVFEGAISDLSAALSNYFSSKKGERKGQKMGFPKFKTKKNKKQSFRLNNDKFKVEGHQIRIPNLGWVNMAEALRFQGKIMGAVVSLVAGHWYISIQGEVEQPEPSKFEQTSTGVDLGVKTLATLSNGDEFENQKLLRYQLNKLKKLNRAQSRRKLQSNRWYKAKAKLARCHEKVNNQRADAIHKMTTAIASTYQTIGVEDLQVAGLAKNRKLALSIADAGMGEVLRQLKYKAAAFGGRVVEVSRWYASSKTCNDCGDSHNELTLSDRTWVCQGCGVIHQRDWNAAKNIEQEALRLVSA